ncbi:MAG TPA: flagellar hook-basal body complex protein FliE [Terracidiphilus sp.]|nr:flagellar hook-basal body complex protein FliE [Terracidiphilus sp.]
MSPTHAVASLAAGTGSLADQLPATNAASDAPFGGLFREALAQMNGLEGEARTAVDGLMTGSGVDVHQAVIATQKVEMAFELALAVHNKAIQAYQSVMGMQF